ncbi:hypothetical protein J2Y45_004698 [Dyadobacter sp. BE34]|uniref:Uncharacterized protein n=1 Tax=Dyadobacter fermentans TaxID=94254 RepID=A0ABU1R268_9BACT|nr:MULTISPECIES: hypothetical protein [Dyadobacter]MDR6807498.1 hypothetical protein [Dyadobacter fermentans]MDR7045239.1 hypothetical protein [Dyadobacter sp. BE242]MDR7199552.1 hypothetical protein [Dyadobacter sp. BE34]MDR7217989.1 hypothetical protein [Dyadobacter sp. BE31]MDR7265443.1 hypothetical protein [Dyadobacter sp. BE32]
MKIILPFALTVLLSLSSLAQAPTDSMAIVQNPQLYTLKQPEDLNIKGQIDAARHYKRYKGAATGTLLTSLLSPVIGLIPAILCSATNPKIENLGYPNEELFKQATYYKAYTKKAKKIKQRKVWSNWGIGLGVNLVVILVLAN